MSNIQDKARKIKLVLLDIDGVMTDGRMIYDNRGNELKNFNVNDGLGIFLIKKAGIKTAIITAQSSNIVKRRAKVLSIDKVYADYHYKIEALGDIKQKFRVQEDEICFVGDELIDMPILKRVGLAVAVSNAINEVKKIAHVITEKSGGKGAVREVCELILKAQGKWDEVTAVYFE